jgi:hypothetical protein
LLQKRHGLSKKGKKDGHKGPSIEKKETGHMKVQIYEKNEDSHVLKNIPKGRKII